MSLFLRTRLAREHEEILVVLEIFENAEVVVIVHVQHSGGGSERGVLVQEGKTGHLRD